MSHLIFLLIDNFKPTNLLHEEIIKKSYPEAQIHSYTEPEKALQMLKQNDLVPDFIFLDIHMYGMDGWEFLEAYTPIKKANTKLYMLSIASLPENEAKAKEHPEVKALLTKPLEKETLQNIIEP